MSGVAGAQLPAGPGHRGAPDDESPTLPVRDAVAGLNSFVANRGASTTPVAASGPSDLPSLLSPANRSISVGRQPSGLAYDPALGEVFVADSGSSNISVINDSSETVVASIGVGADPGCLAYDPGTDELYVVNSGSGNVSVISTASDKVVVNVAVGPNPSGCAYDTRTRQVFVVNSTRTVSVISAATDTVVHTIPVGFDPGAAAYDPERNEILVINQVSQTLSLISDVNDTVVGTIGNLTDPVGVAYDSGTGEIAVVNQNHGLLGFVSFFSDATDQLVGSASVGTYATNASYDAAGNLLLVVAEGDAAVNIVAAATGEAAATVRVGASYSHPVSAVYDTAKANLWVSDQADGQVSVVPIPPPRSLLSARPNPVAIGGRVVVSASAVMGVPPLKWTLAVNGSSANITGVANGSYVFVPHYAGNYTFYLNASDADEENASAAVTVYVPTILAELTANPSRVFVGGETNLSLFILGTPTITWTLTRNGSNANLSGVVNGSYTFAPQYPGTYTFYLNATDSQGKRSNAAVLVDVPSLNATLAASLTRAPVGDEVRLNFSISGGVRPVAWTLAENGSSANLSGVSGNAYVFVPRAVGNYTFYLNATDADGATSNASVTISVPASYGRAVTVGAAPDALAYDPAQGEVFVSNSGSGTVSVINDTTDGVVATIPLPGTPGGLAYDSGKGEVFVVDSANSWAPEGGCGCQNVSVIAVATNQVVANVNVSTALEGIAYDSRTGQLFVTDLNADNVSVISDESNAVVATIPVGYVPQADFYDPGTSQVFVFNDLPKGQLDNTASVISDANDTVVATIPTPGFPFGAAYVPGTGQIFFAGARENGSDDSVGVISDATDTVLATVGVGDWPDSVAYDPVANEVFTANWGSNTTSAISDETHQVVGTLNVGTNPDGVVYDSGTNQLFVANSGDQNVTILSLAEPAGEPVSFTETGLPAGTNWSVTLGNSTQSSFANTITFHEPNGAYAFAVGGVTGYGSSPGSGSVIVSGEAVERSVTFSELSSEWYPVTFTETGLPSGTEWWANESGHGTGGTSSTLSWTEPNGTFGYTAATANKSYAATGGTYSVSGRALSVGVTFSLLTYSLTFLQDSLPPVTNWSVTVGGTTGASNTTTLTLPVANGTYAYLVSVSNPSWQVASQSGNATVRGNTTIVLWFARAYTITITESGLPSGSPWSVEVDGTLSAGLVVETPSTGTTVEYRFRSDSSTLSFSLPNGTYAYTVAAGAAGWSPSNRSGVETITGGASSPTVAETFSQATGPGPSMFGLGLATFTAVISGAVIAVAACGGAALWTRRRKPAAPSGSPAPGAPPNQPPGDPQSSGGASPTGVSPEGKLGPH